MGAVTVIAEAGVNHNGSLELALQLVDAAADAGADIVKFQTFRADELATATATKAAYQLRNAGGSDSQLDMLKALELNDEAHRRLLAHCEKRGIAFLSTPFDAGSLALLVDGLGLRRVKVGSGDMTNALMLLDIARRDCEIILSTGMATMGEIEEALGVLAFGYSGEGEPSRAAFRSAFASSRGQNALQRKAMLLHCTSDYPADPAEINLRAMDTLASSYGLPVGFSDHSEGIAIAIAAVGRGAVMIEKHLTLDRSLPGPDHRASIEPADFAAMVAGIRQVELALGDGAKAPMPSEIKTIAVARKSLVARDGIRAGDTFTEALLGVKRPGLGLPPIMYWDLLGKPATRDYRGDDPIVEELV